MIIFVKYSCKYNKNRYFFIYLYSEYNFYNQILFYNT